MTPENYRQYISINPVIRFGKPGIKNTRIVFQTPKKDRR